MLNEHCDSHKQPPSLDMHHVCLGVLFKITGIQVFQNRTIILMLVSPVLQSFPKFMDYTKHQLSAQSIVTLLVISTWESGRPIFSG